MLIQAVLHFQNIDFGTDSLVYQLVQRQSMSAAAAIRPTKHALERFQQRVMPLLPEHTRVEYRKYNKMKHLINRVQLYSEDIRNTSSGLLKIDVFLQIDGVPPIPLTYVINPVEKLIVTLYTQSGWDVSSDSGELKVRWSM